MYGAVSFDHTYHHISITTSREEQVHHPTAPSVLCRQPPRSHSLWRPWALSGPCVCPHRMTRRWDGGRGPGFARPAQCIWDSSPLQCSSLLLDQWRSTAQTPQSLFIAHQLKDSGCLRILMFLMFVDPYSQGIYHEWMFLVRCFFCIC